MFTSVCNREFLYYKHFYFRLREKLRNQLVDDFVTALEQLNSPELVWKVSSFSLYSLPVKYKTWDILESLYD